ncbi:phage antirepressor KilAC domain-containing protein [Eubacteriales bacterium KG125]
MNELQIFNNEQFGSMRTVKVDNEIWFVAKDICQALDIKNATDTIKRLDNDEVTRLNLGGQVGEVNLVNEYGLYNLVLTSRKKEAKEFKRWVTHEVLPTIRRHGAYMTEKTLEEALTSPDFLIKLATELKSEKEKNLALQVQNSNLSANNAIMQPKADYFDELVDRNLLTNIRETAKQLQIKQTEFVNFLLDKKYLYRDKRGKLMPYADKNKGLFEIKETVNEKTKWCGTQTLITPKGRETFRLLCIKAN